jgi:voltage-gated potassium channel
MHTLIHLLFVSAGILIVGSFLIYVIETPNEDSEITTILDAIWWTAATVTTVGYGDVVPVTTLGRMVGIVFMFTGIAILGIFISALGASLISSRLIQGKKIPTFENQELLIKKIEEIEKLTKENSEILNSLKDKN